MTNDDALSVYEELDELRAQIEFYRAGHGTSYNSEELLDRAGTLIAALTAQLISFGANNGVTLSLRAKHETGMIQEVMVLYGDEWRRVSVQGIAIVDGVPEMRMFNVEVSARINSMVSRETSVETSDVSRETETPE